MSKKSLTKGCAATIKKHAYLIMAHKDPALIQKLIDYLDDSRADIFIHINIKSPINYEEFKSTNSRLFFVPRLNTQWGGESLMIATMNLLKRAVCTETYQYYHLMTGQDLPIKSPDYINDFFDKNEGTEYFDVWTPIFRRLQRNKIFSNYDEINHSEYSSALYDLMNYEQTKVSLQRAIPYEVSFVAGSSCFSITHKAVCYLIHNESNLVKYFSKTMFPEEGFVNTLLYNSDFRKKLGGPLHYTGKRDGAHPVILSCKDLPELLETDCIFARKFDSSVDWECINRIGLLVKNGGSVCDRNTRAQSICEYINSISNGNQIALVISSSETINVAALTDENLKNIIKQYNPAGEEHILLLIKRGNTWDEMILSPTNNHLVMSAVQVSIDFDSHLLEIQTREGKYHISTKESTVIEIYNTNIKQAVFSEGKIFRPCVMKCSEEKPMKKDKIGFKSLNDLFNEALNCKKVGDDAKYLQTMEKLSSIGYPFAQYQLWKECEDKIDLLKNAAEVISEAAIEYSKQETIPLECRVS